MNHNKIDVDGLKKIYAKIPTNPVANSMMYIADLLANLYDFLNIILKIVNCILRFIKQFSQQI